MSTTPVDPIVEMQIDGEWVDITKDVRLGSADSGGGINIVRGTPNEGSVAEPTQIDFVLNNSSGDYSRRNPYSVYAGKLGRNQPIRVGLDRRKDTFQRTEVNSWGRLPSRVTPELQTVLGDRWNVSGTVSNFDVTPGNATIQANSGMQMATFGTYGDVEVTGRVKVSNLTTEFGLIARAKSFIESVDPGDFENGLGTWAPTGGTSTLQVVTTQFHTGTSSALLTVAGSPAQVTARCDAVPAVPGRLYRARMWIRVPVAATVTATMDWLTAAFGYVSSATSAVALAANTWTVLEVSGTAPDTAAFVSYGPNLAASPPNGTLTFIDDVELLDLSDFAYHTSGLIPGAPDVLRLGMTSPGGTSNSSINLSTTVVAGDWYWFKTQMSGIRRRIRFWKDGDPEPTTFWNTRAYTLAEETRDFTGAQYGEVGLYARGGNALVTFSEVTVNVWRAHGEIAELPPRWDLSRRDRWVPVAARGILRRLGQGRKALASAVTLHLETYTTTKMWIPLESIDDGATLAGNLVSTGTPATILNLTGETPDLTGLTALPGVSGFVTFEQDNSSLSAQPAPGSPNGVWSYLCFFKVPSAPSADVLVYTVDSTGTGRKYQIFYLIGGGMRVDVRSSTDTLLSSDFGSLYFNPAHPQGCWLALNLYVFSSAGTVSWALNFHRPGSTYGFFTFNGTFAGFAGAFAGVKYRGHSILTAAGGMSITQLFHYPGDLPFVTTEFARAAYAYDGEIATQRFMRLTLNAGIFGTTTGQSGDAFPMGFQLPAKLLELLEECAAVDDSILMEERDYFGLNMRTRQSLWNQVALELDIDAGHLSSPLDPVDDDQQTRNDVTVSRTNGGFAASVQTSGPLNVNSPETDLDGVGVYDEEPEVNFQSDTQLQAAANWRRSKGTIDEPRYPSIRADLASTAYQASPALAARVTAKDSGDMLAIRNPEVSYNLSRQIVQSYTEHLDQYEWDLTFNTRPGAPYSVGVVNKTTRLATRFMRLQTFYTAGAATYCTTTCLAGGSPWVQVADSPQSFPFVIEVGAPGSGTRLRVRSIGEVFNVNPYFDTDLTGWQASGATTLYYDRYPGQFKSGTASLRATATGATTGGAESSGLSLTTPGSSYQISGWVMSNVALTDVRLAVDWYQADGVTFVSTTLPTQIATTAMTWVHFVATVVAPANGFRARIKSRAVLASTNILWVDDFRLMSVTSFSTSIQTVTVDQIPVNGVTGIVYPGGTPVNVVDPWRIAY